MRVNVPLLFAFFTITIHVFTIVHFDVVHHVFFCCYCLLHHCFQEFYETTNKRGEKKTTNKRGEKNDFFFFTEMEHCYCSTQKCVHHPTLRGIEYAFVLRTWNGLPVVYLFGKRLPGEVGVADSADSENKFSFISAVHVCRMGHVRQSVRGVHATYSRMQ